MSTQTAPVPIIVDRDEFIAYLRDLAGSEVCGFACAMDDCPIARFLRVTGHGAARVSYWSAHVVPEGSATALPVNVTPWMTAHMHDVEVALEDETDKSVTASMALAYIPAE